MTTRTLLLAVHIAGVAAWLGANFVQLVLTPRFAKADRAVTKAWTEATIMLGLRYYNAAGAVIAVSGVLLVLESDWSWSAGFVWVGIAVVVIGGAMGGLLFAPVSNRRSAALDAGDDATAAATLRVILRAAALDTALLLTAVLAMVDKWRA